MSQLRDYWAFISYSQIDREWAEWLHRSLERYSVPKALIGQDTEREHPVPKRIYPVFRDRDELPTGARFSEMLETALKNSRYLIVICSPNAVKSRWVNEEIKYFKKLGHEDRIIYLIVAGEPCASDGRPGYDPEQECFPEAARFRVDEHGNVTNQKTEPIAADVRPGKDGKLSAKLKIIAGVLGVGYSDLTRRDHARKVKRMWLLTSISLALLAVMTTLALLFLVERNRAEEALAARLQLAAQEAQFGDKHGEAILYYNAARSYGNTDLSKDPGFAASWAKCRNLHDQFMIPRAIAYSAFTDNGSKLIVQDRIGEINIRDLNKRKTIWKSLPLMMQNESKAFSRDRVFGIESGRKLVVRDIASLDAVYEKPLPESWKDLRDLTLSADGKLAYFRKLPSPPKDVTSQTTIIHLETGNEAQIESVQSINLANWWFSADSKRLYHAETEGFTGMAIRSWDTATGKLLAEQSLKQPIRHYAEHDGRLVVGFESGFVACQSAISLELIWSASPDAAMPILDIQIVGEQANILYSNQTIKSFDLKTGKEIGQTSIAAGFSVFGKQYPNNHVLFANRTGALQLWQDNKLQVSETWLTDELTNLSLSQQNRMIHSGARNGINRVWQTSQSASDSSIKILRQDGASFRYFLGFETDESGSYHTTDNGVYHLDRTGALILAERTATKFSPDAFPSPPSANIAAVANQMIDGQLIKATISPLGKTTIRTAEDEVLQTFQHPAAQSGRGGPLMQNLSQPGGAMVFSPDQSYLITSHGNRVYAWDWRNGTLSWKSNPIPSGMFGRLFVGPFVNQNQLIIYEGNGDTTIGFPAAYLVTIPFETPDAASVSDFAAEILGLRWENGLIKEL